MPGPSGGAAAILHLQRSAGNQAVAALMGKPGAGRLLDANLPVAPEGSQAEHEAEAHEHDAGPPIAAPPRPRAAAPRSPLAAGAAGQTIPGAVRTSMEATLGRDLSGVRVHRDEAAADMSDALGAEAFTHGSDIFVSRLADEAAIRHEVAHAALHGVSNAVHLKRVKKHLDFLRFKRMSTQLTVALMQNVLSKWEGKKGTIGDWLKKHETTSHFGHWWVEMGVLTEAGQWTPHESYGWWPKERPNYKSAMGIGGKLDGQLNAGEQQDRHHGDEAEEEFHPVLSVEDNEPYEQVRDRVAGEVRAFAKGFTGTWNWRLGWGKNCHTFQERMKKHLGVHHQTSKSWLRGGGVRPKTAAEILDLIRTSHAVGAGEALTLSPATLLPADLTLADYGRLSSGQRREVLTLVDCTWQQMNRALGTRYGQAVAVFRETDAPPPPPEVIEQPKIVEPPKPKEPEGPGKGDVVRGQQQAEWIVGDKGIGMLKGGAPLTAITGEVDIMQIMGFDDDVKTYLATIMKLTASQFEAQMDKVVLAAQ